jgi:hypothetical protein
VNIISLISGGIKLVNLIMKWMETARLVKQGRKEQVNADLLEWRERVDKAATARRRVPKYFSGVRDKHKRD